MSSAGLAGNAYKITTNATATPRSVEYQALVRLNGELGVTEKKKRQDYPAYVRALSNNLKFWTIVGADAASEGSPLPAQLRSQLFYLYEFTQHHTSKIFRGDKTLTVDPLVEINKNIMTGLRGTLTEQEA